MLAAVAFACLLAACPAAPAEHPRAHSHTVESANDGAAEFAQSFGSDWSVPRPYIDMLLAGNGDLDRRVRALGFQTMAYEDVNYCSSRSWPHPNPWPAPDCAGWPDGAFYAEPDHPERLLSARLGGDILQRVLDPDTQDARERARHEVEGAVGGGDSDVVELDDASPPDEYYGDLCWGTFGPGHGCDGAPGGEVDAQQLAGLRAGWLRGMRALVAAMPRPVVLNGLGGYDQHERVPAIAALVVSAPNAWGAMCDGCFYGAGAVPTNRFQWSGPLFEERMEGAIRVTAAGKNVVYVNAEVTDERARARALADIALAYDPERSWFWYAPCGRKAHVHACPEASLTFYAPLVAYPAHLADLKRGAGVYAREFGTCYDDGKPLGPCATVVNADPDAAHALPALRHAYRHTLRITGQSLCQCYGESGSVAVDGPRAPDPLPASSGYLLFR